MINNIQVEQWGSHEMTILTVKSNNNTDVKYFKVSDIYKLIGLRWKGVNELKKRLENFDKIVVIGNISSKGGIQKSYFVTFKTLKELVIFHGRSKECQTLRQNLLKIEEIEKEVLEIATLDLNDKSEIERFNEKQKQKEIESDGLYKPFYLFKDDLMYYNAELLIGCIEKSLPQKSVTIPGFNEEMD